MDVRFVITFVAMTSMGLINSAAGNAQESSKNLKGEIQEFEQNDRIWQQLNTRLMRGNCQLVPTLKKGEVQEFKLNSAVWHKLNTRLMRGNCQLVPTVPSLLKARINDYSAAGNLQLDKLSSSADAKNVHLIGEVMKANVSLRMDNCPPLDPAERSRWLILDQEVGAGKQLFNQWLEVRDRIREYIDSCWTKQAMGVGRAYMHFVVWPSGRISNVELQGKYWGERSFADRAVKFVQSMSGNEAFRFPSGSQSPDAHFQLWLENGDWEKLEPHLADENVPLAERKAIGERNQRRLKDLQIWLKEIGRSYSQVIIDHG